jgi:hypothetical protein
MATLQVQRIEGNRMAFAWAIAHPKQVSPSKKDGREYASKRLAEVLNAWKESDGQYTRLTTKDPDFCNEYLIGGIIEVDEIVPTLFGSLNEFVQLKIPTHILRKNVCGLDDIISPANYLELFVKIRNDVENGKL